MKRDEFTYKWSTSSLPGVSERLTDMSRASERMARARTYDEKNQALHKRYMNSPDDSQDAQILREQRVLDLNGAGKQVSRALGRSGILQLMHTPATQAGLASYERAAVEVARGPVEAAAIWNLTIAERWLVGAYDSHVDLDHVAHPVLSIVMFGAGVERRQVIDADRLPLNQRQATVLTDIADNRR